MRHLLPCLLLLISALPVCSQDSSAPRSRWTPSILTDTNSFPIAVWLQAPRNAARYKAAGINLYVGLWRGPTAEQLNELEKAGMPVICSQNRYALDHKENKIIVGWMHGDEPDNAQPLRDGKGYGPPILPEMIIEDYRRIREADPTRPVLLNLGQGVAWDNWIGRGVRRNRPEDYPEYIKGGDIISFDIYPAVHDHPDVAGKLEFVPRGVSRLREWSGDRKIIWNCIEAARIGNPKTKPTPEQIRSEVWMSIVHGSRGIIYFVHQFEPSFKEASLLDDAELLPAVAELNGQLQKLAPIIHAPAVTNLLKVESSNSAPIATTVREVGGETYVFAVSMRGEPVSGAFELTGIPEGMVEVLYESRSLPLSKGRFQDEFKPYQPHVYRVHPTVKNTAN